jgi:predicted nuclease of predicted toxin-antitoxin system
VKPRILLDENVSLSVAPRLRALGFDATAVAERQDRGLVDEDVFNAAIAQGAVLVTRDNHFTNPFRFDPARTAAIIHIAHGNLTTVEESAMLERFLLDTPAETYAGRLVSLAKNRVIIR